LLRVISERRVREGEKVVGKKKEREKGGNSEKIVLAEISGTAAFSFRPRTRCDLHQRVASKYDLRVNNTRQK